MMELQKILYVEDDSDIREVARIALQILGGFNVRICESGLQCLEQAPVFKPDMIILDVMMPGMDGPETYQRLRQLPCCQSTPVIFMTARVQSHEMAAYRAAGALSVISKPFDPVTLPARLREIWLSRSK